MQEKIDNTVKVLGESERMSIEDFQKQYPLTPGDAFIDSAEVRETDNGFYKLPAVQGSDLKLNIPESSVPEWAKDFCEPVSGEPQRPATLTELFVMYRSISDKIDQVKNEMAPLQLKLAPLTLALQDQQELIDAKLKSQGIEKGKAEGYAYTYTSSTKTVILDETLVPDECMTAKPDAKKIKDFLSKLPKDADQTEYGAQLVKSKSLNIKPLKDDEEDES